jgi:hypothetical protein
MDKIVPVRKQGILGTPGSEESRWLYGNGQDAPTSTPFLSFSKQVSQNPARFPNF